MKYMKYLYVVVLFMSAVSASADCHYVDNYFIHKICDPPPEQHQERRDEIREKQHGERNPNFVQPVYVSIPQSLIPASAIEPPPVSDASTDDFRRSTIVVEDRLHQLHLLLIDKQTRGEISASFFDEENRYLAEIERDKQSNTDSNGGYLTIAQENILIQKLQDVENEINLPNNG